MILKDIIGYEGLYKVSECGKVFRIKEDSLVEVSQVLSGVPKYKYVNLKGDNNRKLVRVHMLVAEAFCQRESEYNVVDHIDRDKLNNHYTNLRWTTHSGNQRNRAINRFVDGTMLIDLLQEDYGHTSYYSWFVDNNFIKDFESYNKGKEVKKFYQEHGCPMLKEVEWWGVKYRTETLAAILNVRCTTITDAYTSYSLLSKPLYQLPTEIQGVLF